TRASHQRTSKSTLHDDQLSDSNAVYLIIEKILVAQQKALIAAISHMNMSCGS
ncbi:hypothetical protein O181_123962, partial [Austropuccinia psidii MF-1]|nr:hypothetical protein [Austropuccinia psidii MF-1]